jgi:predicted transcriptional regulator
MQKKIYKYENRMSVSYSAAICREIFFYSTVLGITMQDIQRAAVSEWIERQNEKRLDAAARFNFLDKE